MPGKQEKSSFSHGSPMASPIDSPIKPQCSPITPMDTQKCVNSVISEVDLLFGAQNMKSIETHGRMGEMGETKDEAVEFEEGEI